MAMAGKGRDEMDELENTFSYKITISRNVSML